MAFGADLDLRSLRAIRLVRVFRVLKVGRYSRAAQSLGLALRNSAAQLGVVLFGLAIVLVLAASLLYFEHEAQLELED